ncbi:integrase core domain-containing protein [Mycobacterium sp. PDNC021]|uniref:integrase core domain-containing protein n=1 Tax=Mycobacterium sp. PDNC021 TaxID=3391399 RepID=UPI003AAF77D4
MRCLSGIVRGREHRTTIVDRNASRAPDLLERDFIVTSQAGSGSPTSSALEGIAASIGSVGNAYDNALAETTMGLFKTEALGPGSPFRTGPLRTLDDVEYPIMQWVHRYNNRRLHSPMDYIPPVEYESAYYARLSTTQPTMSQT